MSERMPAEIQIGGAVPASVVPALIEHISAENPFVSWEEVLFEATTGEELLALAKCDGRPGTLRLIDYEAVGGQFDDLEGFLVGDGIAFDRHCAAKYEYDAQLVQFRPGMDGPYVWLANQNGQPHVALTDLVAVREALKTGKTEGALRALQEALGPEIPPLEPLQIVGQAEPSADEAIDEPVTVVVQTSDSDPNNRNVGDSERAPPYTSAQFQALTAEQQGVLRLVAESLGRDLETETPDEVFHLLQPCDGCVPEDEVGDDLLLTIRQKFACVYGPALRLAEDVLAQATPPRGVPSFCLMIDPSYEDGSWIAVLDHDEEKRPFCYLFDRHKAWHFHFESLADLAEAVLEIRDRLLHSVGRLLAS